MEQQLEQEQEYQEQEEFFVAEIAQVREKNMH